MRTKRIKNNTEIALQRSLTAVQPSPAFPARFGLNHPKPLRPRGLTEGYASRASSFEVRDPTFFTNTGSRTAGDAAPGKNR